MALSVKRKFNGKIYTLRTHNHTKTKAKEIAKTIRGAGKQARVAKHAKGAYAVYAR